MESVVDFSNKVTQLNVLDFICQRCEVLNLCPANILCASERKKFSCATMHNEKLDAGEHLFWPGDQPYNIYIVQSGSFKTYVTNVNGDLQITGFYFPGDILGFNSFGQTLENYGAIALESATICKTPLVEYERIEAQYPALTWAFLKSLSKDIRLKKKLYLF